MLQGRVSEAVQDAPEMVPEMWQDSSTAALLSMFHLAKNYLSSFKENRIQVL